MSSNFTTYLRTTLALTGVCILDSSHAQAARPDLWSTDTFAACDWPKPAEMDGAVALTSARRFVAEVEGPDGSLRRLRIAVISADKLKERLGQLLGLDVLDLKPALRFAEGSAAAPKARAIEDAPPAQACHARDLWFEAHPGQVDPQKEAMRRVKFGPNVGGA
jgi:hypothetical protein